VKKRFLISKGFIFLGLFFLGSLFSYTGKVLDPALVPRMVFISVVLFFFMGFLLFRINRGPGAAFPQFDPMIWIYLGYVLLSGVSVIMSVNPGEGIWEFLKIVVFFLVFFVVVLWFFKIENIHKQLTLIFIPFSAIVLYFGIVQLVGVFRSGTLDHQTSYLINSVFAHRNLYAQILFFTIPFLLTGVFFWNGFIRLLGFFLIALALVMITLLLVKSAWLAVIVATGSSFFLLLIFRKSFQISFPLFKKILIYFFVALMTVLISVAIYSRFSKIETFKKQTHVLKNYKYGSAIERIHLWEKSFQMFKEHPLIGIGAGNWRIYLPHYTTAGLRSAQGEIIYQRPHNDFLWVLSERGSITFGFYVSLFLLSLFYQIRIIAKSKILSDKYFALILFYFMIGYIIFASLSFPSERPVHSLLLSLVFGLTCLQYQKIKEHGTALKVSHVNIILSLGLMISSFTVYAGYSRLKSEHHTRKALNYRMQSKWHQVIQEIDQAETFFTRLDPTATPLRWYSGLSWYNIGNMENAGKDFLKARRANPYHMHVLNNLGTIYGRKGDYEKAIELYKEAVRISPDFTDAVLNLSAALYNTGHPDSAYKVLTQAKEGGKNPNYENVVTTLVYAKVEKLKKGVDDRDLELTLTRIRNSKAWMVKVHEQAIRDQVPLEKHLIIESVYMLETVDSTISSERAARLKEKYLSR
jgi:O-antigen ligase/Tfp pilus assembly protein PilF